MAPKFPVEVLWCGNRSVSMRRNGWSFPPAVANRIKADVEGQTVLHLFGGRATFGTRMDIDPLTNPDVVGDAWLPPFARDSFDVVVLDPPYVRLNQQEKNTLLRRAAWIARQRLIWFHVMWVAADRFLRQEKAYLVRVGDACQVRCLQYFTVSPEKSEPDWCATHGPAVRYNRWVIQPQGLPFPVEARAR